MSVWFGERRHWPVAPGQGIRAKGRWQRIASQYMPEWGIAAKIRDSFNYLTHYLTSQTIVQLIGYLIIDGLSTLCTFLYIRVNLKSWPDDMDSFSDLGVVGGIGSGMEGKGCVGGCCCCSVHVFPSNDCAVLYVIPSS